MTPANSLFNRSTDEVAFIRKIEGLITLYTARFNSGVRQCLRLGVVDYRLGRRIDRAWIQQVGYDTQVPGRR